MTKVKSEIRLETRNIRFKRQLKLNAWCWLFMLLAVVRSEERRVGKECEQ